MSHQLMSAESLTPEAPSPRPSSARLHDYRRAKEADPDFEPLRRQVSTIIDAILADNAPDEAEVREKLRRHVARNPGRPEQALLGHLISMADRQDEAG
ncbi:MAG: hypothetical protein JWM01_689 [Arthrobacter sp.]|jgi:hypothetical protein|nr:hypothetical protein [Arthrobacter sp.]MCU1520888.1 hypothetical protein [Arthrobacter sp.]MCU1539742.1 hypothetical protein [Arthrobacter sp.]MCU1553272.1 hypothetical protein [Arthrobacter sp.]